MLRECLKVEWNAAMDYQEVRYNKREIKGSMGHRSDCEEIKLKRRWKKEKLK